MNDACLTPILATAALPIPWSVFWPYFSGITLLLVGLFLNLRAGRGKVRGLEWAVSLAPVLVGAPIGVFGTEHFVFTSTMIEMVPSFLPWHLFWIYFTGTCLIAAALSLVARRHSGLAASLLGLMLFCFVALIWVPNNLAEPGNRFGLAVILRDFSFSCGCFALALREGAPLLTRHSSSVIPALRAGIGMPLLFFGAEHFLYPGFVPVIPLSKPMPAWMPAHAVIAYGTGVALLICGASLLLNLRPRLIGSLLGVFVLGIVMVVYLPLLVAEPSVEVGVNYFMDTLMYAGVLLALAGALPKADGVAGTALDAVPAGVPGPP
jgi:putative oxidoreductase